MAITTSPAYPLPGEEVTIAESAVTGDVQVVAINTRPSASTKTIGFLVQDVAVPPVGIFDIVEGSYQTNVTTFDEPGEYGVTIYDMRQWAGSPSFDGDGAGELRYQLIATFTGTVHVSALVDLPILAEGERGITLQLTVNDETVRDAELLDATATDEAARVAALNSTVTAALAALVGNTVAAVGTDLQTGVADLRTKYEAHRKLLSGVHIALDSTNQVSRGDPDSQAGAISLLNELRDQLLRHLWDATGALVPWHPVEEDDLKNVPVAALATDLATATILSADLRERCYERHRVQTANPASHGSADTTNTLAAPSLLDDLIVTYLDELVKVDPSVVSGEPEGAIDAEHRYGFERAP
jgi:hypothetical protein